MEEARKFTPEELARQNRAEKQMQEIDKTREQAAVQIELSARPLSDDDEASSIESLIEDFPDQFVQAFKLNGKTHEWHCHRKSHFDIFPDADEDDDELSMRALYSDAVAIITAVVFSPEISEEQLKKLPVSLVTRISRGIQDEIMPRYTEDTQDTIEESE